MDIMKDALRIRAFRKLKGFTQTGLAERMGVSVSVLGAVERGARRADPKLIELISEALDISPRELLPKNNL
ncbi:MAG: helix-turn-helix transcriptional regulator [Gorillibacterium sp.]|nr:helix-turn-helix transcriptional regulator [Gorillibacterium sp.]